MWVPIIAVCLVVAMLVGPIMMVQPSPRQALLARLRIAASTLGMSVQIQPDPRNEQKEKIAAYGLTLVLPAENSQPLPSWLIFRQQFAHNVHYFKEWDWQEGSEDCLIELSWLQAYLAQLPPAVIAVQQSGQHVALYWTERWAKPKTMEEMLDELNGYLTELKSQ